MKYSIEIGKIVEGALKQDRLKVKNYVEKLIQQLELDEQKIAANKFKRILISTDETSLKAMSNSEITKIPVDGESRAILADIVLPHENKVEVILSDHNRAQVIDFIDSFKKADELNNFGIAVPNSLMLYGPPGCGKSKAASLIAKEVDLPLVVARIDSLISSYLGTTAKNIRNLFEYAQRTPCVLFLDEFDAIAKARDDHNELGELKRVVNSLLQNIDSLNEGSLLLCATNHEELLDKAVWRRFDYKINIGLPDFNARKKLISLFIRDKKISEKEINEFAHVLKDTSGSDIEEIIIKSLRNSVLRNEEFTLNMLYSEFFKFEGLILEKFENEKQLMSAKAKYLRICNDRIFSYNRIGNILSVSKTTVSNLLNEVTSNE